MAWFVLIFYWIYFRKTNNFVCLKMNATVFVHNKKDLNGKIKIWRYKNFIGEKHICSEDSTSFVVDSEEKHIQVTVNLHQILPVISKGITSDEISCLKFSYVKKLKLETNMRAKLSKDKCSTIFFFNLCKSDI